MTPAPAPAPAAQAPAAAHRLALARRYRPRSLSELTGQRHVAAVMSGMLTSGSVPQQILLSGNSGLGKTTVARIIAAALLCQTPLGERARGDACGRCEACRDVLTPGRSHQDVIEFDAASNGGKDEIRDIAARASLSPARGPVKIYIIDEAHGLTAAGGQAFLKLLEEPPSHTVWMLATTDPDKLPRTLRGRCTEFELLRPTDAELTANLRRVCAGEGWTLTDEVAAAVLAATDPALGVRGTLMTLEKLATALSAGRDLSDADLVDLLGVALGASTGALTGAVAGGDPAAALAALEQLRERIGDSAARAALVTWAHRELLEAAAGRAATGVPVAAWRLDVLLSAQPGPVWTTLAVAKIACPAMDPSSQTVAVHAAEVEELTARLNAAAQQARAALAHAPAPAPAPAVAAASHPTAPTAPTEPPSDRPSRTAPRAGDTSTIAPARTSTAEPAPTDAAQVTGQAPAAAAVTGALLDAVPSRRVQALLRSCTLEPTRGPEGSVVRITAPSEALSRLLSTAEVRREIDASTAATGITVAYD